MDQTAAASEDKQETDQEYLEEHAFDWSVRQWDPERYSSLLQSHNAQCLMRIKKDIEEFFRQPPEGIVALPNADDITKVKVLMVGPKDTPYDRGFFVFLLRFPKNYPDAPPLVKNLTTGNGEVRFNPNMYANGMLCLSILGTWPGPSWTAALSLTTVLVSIQSIMNEWPYYNEPGYENQPSRSKEAQQYNDNIVYETLRVAVCNMMQKVGRAASECPQALWPYIEKWFLKNYDFYVSLCDKYSQKEGTSNRAHNFELIRERLNVIKESLKDQLLDKVEDVNYLELSKKLYANSFRVATNNENEVLSTSDDDFYREESECDSDDNPSISTEDDDDNEAAEEKASTEDIGTEELCEASDGMNELG